MRQTTMLKPAEVKKDWYVVDASGKTLGRLATQCAAILRGKHKPTYTPNVYYHHSMYPGGLKARSIGQMKREYPVELVEKAVQGMLPHNKLGDRMRTHLYVYEGAEHPHTAQKPIELK